MEDSLSPTSVLRLNFDSLLAETTDSVPSEDDKGASAAALWDAVSTTLPNCVRTHRMVSWIEEGLHAQPVFFNEVLCVKKVADADPRPCPNYNMIIGNPFTILSTHWSKEEECF